MEVHLQLIEGDIPLFVSIILDVTERKRVERALKESEEKYRGIFNDSVAAVYAFDTEKRFLDSNQAGLDLLGYSLKELLNMSIPDVDADPKSVLPAHSRLLEGERLVNYEHQLKRKDGGIITVLNNSRPLTDSDGKVTGMLSTLIDITERKRAENEIIRAKEEWERTFNAVSDPMIVLDKQHKIVRANQAMADALGVTPQGVVGLNCYTVVHGTAEPPWFCPHSRLLIEGREQTAEIFEEGLGGDFLISVSPLLDSDGQVVGAVHTARNIGDRKRKERVQAAQLRLVEFSANHSIKELLEKFLDEAEVLTKSDIGFYHFVESDQETLSLQAWSTNTLNRRDCAELVGLHYPISKAGVWVDCVRERRPVIHNNYPSLHHKKGLPEGHPPIDRELVVPVIRGDQLVAVLGVGNKKTDYDQNDLETVQQLADFAWETVVRRMAEESLRESENRYRVLFENINDLIIVHDLRGRLLKVNPEVTKLLGYSEEKMIGRQVSDFISPRTRSLFREEYMKELNEHRRSDGVVIFEDINKEEHLVEYRNILVEQEGKYPFISGVGRDITERRRIEKEKAELEKQLRQSQKMESIGVMAGGIAHDFNNTLQVISGYTELMFMEIGEHSPVFSNLHGIERACESAIDLVRKLLLFSRKAETEKKPIDINMEIEQCVNMLQRTIPKMISIEVNFGRGLWPIIADSSQIKQIILNLGTNAADAMPDGGRLVIRTENTVVEEEKPNSHAGVNPGNYVLLTVSDTGLGMDQETIEHIFEPFFTTKEIGKGTGLGLASVYGIVKNHGGHIDCRSEVGHGTIFRVFFPANEEFDPPTDRSPDIPIRMEGTETILLVDDDKSVRDVISQILGRFGYSVLSASSGEEALEVYSARSDEISLVILDLGMPGMGGHRCLKELLRLDSAVKIMISSGYSIDAQLKKTLESGASAFISKPFQMLGLLEKVRAVLDQEA